MQFTSYGVYGNECHGQELVITERNQIITSVNGHTESYYHSQNITCLNFNGQTMNFMPKGLEKLFPQIEQIWIYWSNLKEIKKEDLAPFPMLKSLFTYYNDLETLPSDLFEANLEITHVRFQNERLKFVGENILSHLKKLTRANFEENPCVDMRTLTKAEIPALITELQSKCKPPQGIKTEPQEPKSEPQEPKPDSSDAAIHFRDLHRFIQILSFVFLINPFMILIMPSTIWSNI
jgi:Leucine-rich repeat (LRR) protein